MTEHELIPQTEAEIRQEIAQLLTSTITLYDQLIQIMEKSDRRTDQEKLSKGQVDTAKFYVQGQHPRT